LYFITSNRGKVEEASVVLGEFGFQVIPFNARKLEVQSESLEEVAVKAAESLMGRVPEPFFVEDSGLFVESLNGFPGPYSSYVYRTIGLKGLLKLLEDIDDRRAKFVAVVALCYEHEIRVFRGEVGGVISEEARGYGGFGFDPVFVPKGFNRTFAEMSLNEKCKVSHRAKALRAMGRYLAYLRDT